MNVQLIIKDLDANEVEGIIDNNFGTTCEWLDGSDDTGNRYAISYHDNECLGEMLEALENAGADYEEI